MKMRIENSSALPALDRVALGMVWAIAIVTLVGILVLAAVGCQSAEVSAATKNARIQKAAIASKAEIDAANAKAKGKVADAKAHAAPASHPIATANLTTKELHAAWLPISIVAGVLFAVSVGLLFTGLSWLSKIGVPVFGSLGAFAYLNLIALPFLPWIIGGCFVALIGLGIYEVVRHKSIGATVAVIDTELKSVLPSGISGEISKVVSEAESILPKAGTQAAPIVITPVIPK